MKVGKGISIILAFVAISSIVTGIMLNKEKKAEDSSISITEVENALVQFVRANYQVNVDSTNLSSAHVIKVTLQSLKDNHNVDISTFTSKYPCDFDHTYVLIEINQDSIMYHPHLSCSIFE